MKTFLRAFLSSMNKEQKEATSLLQVGALLEYFDLMLYVHLAVFLNDLFFPKADLKTESLLTAFAFCSTYLLRPLGAIFLGFVGDNFGRRTAVIMTTMVMATSCIIMATLPTYAQIGITAAWIVTICRMAQGLSSMGEVIGAEIYMTEITKPPLQYAATGLIGCASRMGAMAALGVAYLVTNHGFNWRTGFWIGATIAVLGSIIRTRLRETPAFIDMKRHLNRVLEDVKQQAPEKTQRLIILKEKLQREKVSWKTILAYFTIASGAAFNFYFIYFYCGGLLRMMGVEIKDIIYQNLIVSIIDFGAITLTVFLSYRIYPLNILKFKTLLYFPLLCAFPFLMIYSPTPSTIFLIQIIGATFGLIGIPACSIVFSCFPVFKRFTYISFIYGISRSLMAVIISFGLVYLTEFLGILGIYLILGPMTFSFLWGVYHYERLEHRTEKSFLRSLFEFNPMFRASHEVEFQSAQFKKVQER